MEHESHHEPSIMIKNKIVEDAKRMLPVWLIMVSLVVGSLFVIRYQAVSYLEAGIIESSHAPAVAEVAYNAGVHDWRKLVALVDEKRRTDDLVGKVGELKGNPLIADAKEHFMKSLVVYPYNLDVNAKLAQLEFWDGNESTAYYFLGEEALVSGLHKKAEYNFSKALELEPDNLKYKVSLSANFARQGLWDKAKEVSDTFYASVDDHAEAQRLLARIEIQDNDLIPAIQYIERAIELEPTNSEGYEIYFSIIGSGDELINRLVWIEEKLNAASTVNPTSFHRVALLYKNAGAYEDSLRVYNKLTTIIPQNVRILIEKAFVEAKVGNNERARLSLERALSLDYGIFIDYFQQSQFDSIRDLNPSTNGTAE